MGVTVVLAEKPSVARDIARVLGASSRAAGYLEGGGYRVTWALGHLIGPCDPGEMDPAWGPWRFDRLPMLPQTLKLKVLPRSSDQYAVVAALITQPDVDRLVCATDAGREGELIFRHIYSVSGCNKPFSRLWISSMTDEAIREGFAALREGAVYDGLYDSARCRQDADWIVGMNLSRAYTLRYNARLSVGRVQTPTLSLLVKRRREIEAFVPETYYEVTADFGDYTGVWFDQATLGTRIAEEARARAIAAKVKGQEARVASVEAKRERTPPPHLLDLTTLQREANTRGGLTAEQTLAAAQALYETHKALTYPRTDAHALPADMHARASAAMSALSRTPFGKYVPGAMPGGQLPAPPRVFDDAQVSDHHAIIPTGRIPGALNPHEQIVWDLAVRRFIGAFYPDHEYETVRVVTLARGEPFQTRGRTTLQEGWRALWKDAPSLRAKAGKDKEEPAEDADSALPRLCEGERREVAAASCRKKATRPPAQHTEASLLMAMERAGRDLPDEELQAAMKDSGLGTPATRAAIIERLIEVGYAARDKRALLATDKGCALIDVVPADMSSPELTGRWEKALHDIAGGGMSAGRFMEGIHRFTTAMIAAAKAAPRGVVFPEEAQPLHGRGPAKPAEPPAGASAAPENPAAAAGKPGHAASKARAAAGQKAAAPKAKAAPKPGASHGTGCPLCGAQLLAGEKGYSCARWREGCAFRIARGDIESKIGLPFTDAMLRALMVQRKLALQTGTLSLTAKGVLRFLPKK